MVETAVASVSVKDMRLKLVLPEIMSVVEVTLEQANARVNGLDEEALWLSSSLLFVTISCAQNAERGGGGARSTALCVVSARGAMSR